MTQRLISSGESYIETKKKNKTFVKSTAAPRDKVQHDIKQDLYKHKVGISIRN